MTHDPFEVINNESNYVTNKYLEGMPSQDNFPGSFQGMTNQQMDGYTNSQSNAIDNYNDISQNPLPQEADKYSFLTDGSPGCENYGTAYATYNPTTDNDSYKNLDSTTLARFKEGTETFKDNSITDPSNESGFGKIVPEIISFSNGENPGWTSAGPNVFMNKDSAEDNPLLDIDNRPIQQFSHNNMVPFYGAKLTQNMKGTDVPQAGDNNAFKDSTEDGFANQTPFRQKLADFTGCDDMYMHKREVGNMFSPAEGITGWVFGSPDVRPDLDRYKDGLWMRNGEAPCEKVQVGPGIGLDYTVAAEGGFQQYNRLVPNNTSEYKSNQLEGRVNAGKWFVNHPESQITAGVSQNKPALYTTQARRPTMQSKFYTNAPGGADSRTTDYNVAVNRGKQNREDTEQSGGFGQFFDGSEAFTDSTGMPCVDYGSAPVGMTMGSTVPKPSQDLQSFNSVRETFKRGSAKWVDGHYEECPDEAQGSNRWDLTMGPASGMHKAGIQRDGYYVNLTDRGDMNPFVINATGTTSGQTWSPNSFQDHQRTTNKETTEFSYQGNAIGANNKPTGNTWSDQQKVTRRETTAYSHAGNPVGANNKPTENTWTDDARVTRKETTAFSHQGSLQGSGMPTNRFQYEGDTN
jgi:hypothetical protein